MLSLNRGRALAALVLALAALLAVTPVLTASAEPDTAVAAKKCKKKNKKKKGCKKRKASSKTPKAGTFLTSNNVRVAVSLRYPQKDLVVQVSIVGLTANCSEGGTQIVGGSVTTPLKGSRFSGRTDYPAGNFAEASGSFSSPTKASGTVRIGNAAIPNKGVCDTGTVSFTVTKP